MIGFIRAVLVSMVLMPNVASSQTFEAGVEAYRAGDYKNALQEFRPLAEQGLREAQFNLGVMYLEGEGVAQDHAEAVKWLRMAAKQGMSNAQYILFNLYFSGEVIIQDHAEGVKWLRRAAANGLPEAQHKLALIYNFGVSSVSQDDAEAVKWYRRAAKQGVSKAQYGLGKKYLNGEGLLQDYVSAHMWFNIASANGFDGFVEWRSIVEKRMTPSQVAEAQSRARTCVQTGYQQCD